MALVCGVLVTVAMVIGAATVVIRSTRALYRGWRRCDRALVQILGTPADPEHNIKRVPSLAERFETLERRVLHLEDVGVRRGGDQQG